MIVNSAGEGMLVLTSQYWGKRDLSPIPHINGMGLCVSLSVGTLFMLLDNKGERAGFLETCPDESGQVLRVTNLMVEDGYRRRGYGSLLLSRARTQARALGCQALSVKVPAGNYGGIRFLLGQGLTLTGYTALPGSPGAAQNEPTLELGALIG